MTNLRNYLHNNYNFALIGLFVEAIYRFRINILHFADYIHLIIKEPADKSKAIV